MEQYVIRARATALIVCCNFISSVLSLSDIMGINHAKLQKKTQTACLFPKKCTSHAPRRILVERKIGNIAKSHMLFRSLWLASELRAVWWFATACFSLLISEAMFMACRTYVRSLPKLCSWLAEAMFVACRSYVRGLPKICPLLAVVMSVCNSKD